MACRMMVSGRFLSVCPWVLVEGSLLLFLDVVTTVAMHLINIYPVDVGKHLELFIQYCSLCGSANVSDADEHCKLSYCALYVDLR